LAGLYATPVLQYTEAVLPAEEFIPVLSGTGSTRGGGGGSFPGPTISILGQAFPAQQLLAVLGDSVLILAKPLQRADERLRKNVSNSGSGKVRSSLHARYGSQTQTAASPVVPSASNSDAAAAGNNEPSAMALCVLPVHMLHTRWIEACPCVLELHCTALGRIPLMTGSTGAASGGLESLAAPTAHACTLECPSPEAALTLQRRLQRASLARMAARHGALAALAQQPLLAAAGEVCWRSDLLDGLLSAASCVAAAGAGAGDGAARS
jgi:hypothetical protein